MNDTDNKKKTEDSSQKSEETENKKSEVRSQKSIDKETTEEKKADSKETNVSKEKSKDKKETKKTTSDTIKEHEEKEKEEKISDPTKMKHPDARWYVIHTYSGHENKVATNLQQRVETMKLEKTVFDVVVPTRNVVTVQHGKKEEQKEKIYPGYILIHMVLNDESWLAVRTTPGVTTFVGAGTKPTPISSKEVAVILNYMKQDAPKYKAKFTVNEAVKIVDGPFADFLGTIEHIDAEKGKVKVLVSIFGRETPVELDFLQISKL